LLLCGSGAPPWRSGSGKNIRHVADASISPFL
jgi:hypothetical protein